MQKAAKQLEEDMSYFDSDEECNKSEYAWRTVMLDIVWPVVLWLIQ